ncbi:hypothetical protein NDU88_005056 [Pleurodeles waltl]|uniref:Uncharacterized protein n=1 Tax=Pleurodeles waltl TaxID=8319 RepID=A0AAV7W8J5_PLEWA|nr:hypothetical protein NDU88_005056 [Pleurodeles waltl]
MLASRLGSGRDRVVQCGAAHTANKVSAPWEYKKYERQTPATLFLTLLPVGSKQRRDYASSVCAAGR